MKAFFALLIFFAVAQCVTEENIGTFYQSYFMKFQTDYRNTSGCYLNTKGVYPLGVVFANAIANLSVPMLPIISKAMTDIIQIFLDRDTCQIPRILNETWKTLKNPDLIKQRLQLDVMIRVLNSIVRGIREGNYAVLGDGCGVFMLTFLAFKLP